MTAHLRAVHGWGNANPAGVDARNSPATVGPAGPPSVQSAAAVAAAAAAAHAAGLAAAAAAAAPQQISPRPTVNVN